MEVILFSLVLFQAVALAAGALLKLLRMRKKIGEEYLTSYLYLLVLLSIFNVYGQWGPGFARFVVFPSIGEASVPGLAGFLFMMGLPFLASAWFMVQRFGAILAGQKPRSLEQTVIVVIMSGTVMVSQMITWDIPGGALTNDPVRLVTAVLHMMVFFIPGIKLLFRPAGKAPWRASRPLFWLGFAFIFCGLMQGAVLLLTGRSYWSDALGVLLFSGATLLPLLILAPSPLIRKGQLAETKGFRAFCKKYGISPREAEISLEISTGKTNQEIADSLFITLQTVKDHAHNIFLKTEVKSRIQLVNLIGKFDG